MSKRKVWKFWAEFTAGGERGVPMRIAASRRTFTHPIDPSTGKVAWIIGYATGTLRRVEIREIRPRKRKRRNGK